ncbi:hypothetical protein ACWV95_36655 [Streptomyces albus]
MCLVGSEGAAQASAFAGGHGFGHVYGFGVEDERGAADVVCFGGSEVVLALAPHGRGEDGQIPPIGGDGVGVGEQGASGFAEAAFQREASVVGLDNVGQVVQGDGAGVLLAAVVQPALVPGADLPCGG